MKCSSPSHDALSLTPPDARIVPPISDLGADAIQLELVGLPARRQTFRQTDFSILPGEVGLDWAAFLGNRLIHADRVPAFTLFRFRQGEYGTRLLADGGIDTGGLQQEMERVDATLAEHFPVTIHVAYVAKSDREPYQISPPHWRGSICVHPISFSSGRVSENADSVLRLLSECAPDVVHLHDPHNELDREIAERIPESIGVVASNHGAPVPATAVPAARRSYVGKFIERYGEHRKKTGMTDSLALTVADTLQFLERRIRGISSVTHKVNNEALKHGHGIYHAFNLSAVSEAGKGNLNNFPSVVVHPPVDSDFFSPERVSPHANHELRYSLKLHDDRPLLLYHARICLQKGQAYLPQVIAEAKRTLQEPFTVVLVGPESEAGAVDRLHREIRRFGQEDSFVVTGGKSQTYIRDLLGISRLCLFPSFNEGLGLTAVEAQLMKVPVIAHAVGGIPEAVRHGVTGSLVAPGDVKGFAREICHLIDSPTLCAEYGHHGRELMIREFDPRRIAVQILERLYLPQLLNTGRVSI